MKSFAVVITLLVGFCCTAQTETDSLGQEIQAYFAVNGTLEQYSEAYDGMFGLIQNQFGGANVPDSVWESLKSAKGEDLGEIMSLLTAVYRKYFDSSDIARMSRHFSLQGAAREADKSDFLNSSAGQKMIQVQNNLVTEIGQTSEYWSRDLYMKTIETLKEKGFYPKQ
jgi:hypothetical protein